MGQKRLRHSDDETCTNSFNISIPHCTNFITFHLIQDEFDRIEKCNNKAAKKYTIYNYTTTNQNRNLKLNEIYLHILYKRFVMIQVSILVGC